MGNNRKNVFILIGVLVGVLVLFSGITFMQIRGEKIAKNTYISGVSVGGKTREEAKSLLSKEYKLENISFEYNDRKWSVPHKDIDLSYDLDDTVKKAYGLNRNNNIFKNIVKTTKTNFGEKNHITVTFDYNKSKLKKEVEKIAKDINVDVKDAKLNIGGSGISVIKEESGLKLNIEKSIKSFEKEIVKGIFKEKLVVNVVEPKIKEEQLKDIDTVLGSYSTRFDSGIAGRSENIRISADRTSNVLLMPGETYSYNNQTGERTISNGYKNAPVIVQGVVQEGIGGGVCQVSSTLYNSVLYSGLEIVNIQNHTIPSSYVGKGRDATVADGGIDFVFKNNFKSPVYVRNYVSGNIVTCQIFGSSKDKQNIEIVTNIEGSSQAPVKKVDDPTLPKGKEQVLERGRNSYTVSTYRVYKDSNGNIIKKVRVHKSYYPKKQEVIAIGTKEEVKQEAPVESSPESTPQNPPQNQPKPETPNTGEQGGDTDEKPAESTDQQTKVE